MKKIEDIQKDIESSKKEYDQVLLDDPKNYSKHKKLKAKISKRIQFLKMVVSYLEFNPTEDFIKKQEAQCRQKIKSVNKQLLSSKITCKKTIAKIRKEEGATLAKSQLNMLNYIL